MYTANAKKEIVFKLLNIYIKILYEKINVQDQYLLRGATDAYLNRLYHKIKPGGERVFANVRKQLSCCIFNSCAYGSICKKQK